MKTCYDMFETLKSIKLSTKFSTYSKPSFKTDREIKTIQYKHKLRQFFNTNPILQDTCKEILNTAEEERQCKP